MIQLATTLTPRWPLYIAEIVFYVAALTISIVIRTKKKTGCQDVVILWPWLMMSIGYFAYLLFEAWQAHSDPTASALRAWWGNVVFLSCGISLTLFLGKTLWKRGS
jgi:hypothetical protein